MKYAHSVKLSVFSHEHEDERAILDSLLEFFPFSLEGNKIGLKKTSATGFAESKIQIFEVTLAKDNLIKRFLDFILENLDEVKKGTIVQQAESRLDQNLDFFIRFDKEGWISNNKLELTDSGKCFHMKISLAAFPKKREIGLKIIRELFK